jgi:CheY-like chemotaxis protein
MDTVLIVDDSSFIVEGLIAFLKKRYIPLAAYGGGECLEILKRETPSVIILDIMMEPMDGWETLTRIKENPKTRYIPVLMFSAVKIRPEEAEKHRISIDDCITKPVSPNKIIEAIEKVLARRDTTRIIVERWQAAGVSQEKIDEYLSLTMSLEVDLSLCQNMKIQYDLGHPNDQDLEEFQAVMSAIGNRILQERDQIGMLAREMNDMLAQELAGRSGSAEVKRPQIADEPGNQHGVSGTRNDNISPLAPEEIPPETLIPDAAVTVSGNLRTTEQDRTGSGATETTSRSIPAPHHPEHEMAQADNGPVLQKTEVSLDEPASTAPEPAGIAPADNPVILSVPSITGAGEPGSLPGHDTEKDDRVREPVPQPASAPVSLAPPPSLSPASDPSLPPVRNVIPADPDIPRDRSGSSSMTGAGTDVPMPWNSLPGRNSRGIISRLNAKTRGLAPEPASPAPGIFARIISLVRSLFGNRK